jgi:hypothetical protein
VQCKPKLSGLPDVGDLSEVIRGDVSQSGKARIFSEAPIDELFFIQRELLAVLVDRKFKYEI